MDGNFSETEELVRDFAAGDRESLDRLFSRHREKLRGMVRVRLDPRVRVRVDDSDVLQEVYTEAARRLAEYVRNPKVPFYVWLRAITGQRLIDLHRFHLGAEARDLRRELPIQCAMPGASSAAVAARLVGTHITPSQKLERRELEARVEEVIERLDPDDREVLVLRHFEELSNSEVAYELGLDVSAASKRYIRALRKLKGAFGEFWTGGDGVP